MSYCIMGVTLSGVCRCSRGAIAEPHARIMHAYVIHIFSTLLVGIFLDATGAHISVYM